MDATMRHAGIAANLPDMSAIWLQVYELPQDDGTPDVDENLYGGFVGNADRRRLDELRAMSPESLADARTGFDDPRLEELLFRYCARNFAETLQPEEVERWQVHRAAKLLEGEGGACNVDQFLAEIDALAETADEKAEEILGALYEYAEAIAPTD